MSVTLSLVTRWRSGADTRPPTYELMLSNNGTEAIANFALAFSGPAAVIDPRAAVENARLLEYRSNYTRVAPPEGFVLLPRQSWQFAIHLVHPLRHYTDGARGAYAVLEDGQLVDVDIGPTETDGSKSSLRKGAPRFALPPDPPVNLSIIPWPNRVAVRGSRPTPQGLELNAHQPAARNAAKAFAELVAELFPLQTLLSAAGQTGLQVGFHDDPQLGPEAYELSFDDSGATVAAAAQTGFLYGLITLGQILRGAQQHPAKLFVPAVGTIKDEPALGWRGTHLDVARQFYPSADIARFLRLLAWNKINRFHWHLSDDEAWRVEIDAYPELTTIGAWRGHGMALPPLLGSRPRATGGYYSKSEIRPLVALGENLGIRIVPEIDVPGHCYAALQSLPRLRDPHETGEYQSVQAFPNNCLNPARSEVYSFIETVIDGLLELFPAGIFHVGADEVPLAAWSGSPEALRLLETLAGKGAATRHRTRESTLTNDGIADAIDGSATAVLHAHFIGRLQRHIAGRGAITGGWEEAAHGNLVDKNRTYLVGWRGVDVSAALAGQGYDVVVSPAQHYYLDMASAPDWAEPGAGWAGSSGPEETYKFEPRAGWSEAQLEHLLGVQACIWSEAMTDGAIFDRLVFPRLSAVAETGWTLPKNKSWPRFYAFAGLMPIMYGHWVPDE